MVKVEIANSLAREIKKKFKGESHKITDLLESLEENPHKGKPLGNVAGLVIKELKYKKFRFYFIVDGFKLKVLSKEELTNLLIRFVRMSDKKSQQKTINEIRKILIKLGPFGFE
jgi:mRNA-degrading endonuclease RelE of RelBE toxin-antitoxin system